MGDPGPDAAPPQGPSLPRRPVILVHGILGQRHLYWNLFRLRLARDGFDVHEAVLPFYLLGDLEEASEHLANQVERILDATGAAAADLVCHSAGGLVGRHASRRLGSRLGHLVTMGTPFHGTRMGVVLAGLPGLRIAEQTRPGSAFLHDLEADPVDGRRLHCLWSPLDGIVIPGHSAAMPGAHNIELPWTGHWMFLWSQPVYEAVRDVLASDPTA